MQLNFLQTVVSLLLIIHIKDLYTSTNQSKLINIIQKNTNESLCTLISEIEIFTLISFNATNHPSLTRFALNT